MDKVISEILQAEQQAQEITKRALEMKKGLGDEIKNQIEDLRKERFAQAKLSIAEETKRREELSNQEVLKIREAYSQRLDEIDKSFNENRTNWVDTIYNKLIGR